MFVAQRNVFENGKGEGLAFLKKTYEKTGWTQNRNYFRIILRDIKNQSVFIENEIKTNWFFQNRKERKNLFVAY